MNWIDWDAIHAIFNFWIMAGAFFAPIIGIVVIAFLCVVAVGGVMDLISRFSK